MKSRPTDFFWPSFTDLMTSLFFVMLVLYVLALLSVRTDIEGMRTLKEVEASVAAIDGKEFLFDPSYKRVTLAQNVRFDTGSDLIPASDTSYLRRAGERLQMVIDRAREIRSIDLKYLIVIEGMASKDNFKDNWGLSYRRALAVYNCWRAQGIQFDPDICEVIISGSGVGGVGRALKEEENQRILVQILPKLRTRQSDALKPTIIDDLEKQPPSVVSSQASPKIRWNPTDSIGVLLVQLRTGPNFNAHGTGDTLNLGDRIIVIRRTDRGFGPTWSLVQTRSGKGGWIPSSTHAPF